MTDLSRRQWLTQMGLGALALGSVCTVAMASERSMPGIAAAVFDARVPESFAFAAGAAIQIETGLLRSSRWRALRAAGLRPGQRIAGLTTWSDFTVARGMLSAKGLRVRSELRRKDGLFEWVMA